MSLALTLDSVVMHTTKDNSPKAVAALPQGVTQAAKAALGMQNHVASTLLLPAALPRPPVEYGIEFVPQETLILKSYLTGRPELSSLKQKFDNVNPLENSDLIFTELECRQLLPHIQAIVKEHDSLEPTFSTLIDTLKQLNSLNVSRDALIETPPINEDSDDSINWDDQLPPTSPLKVVWEDDDPNIPGETLQLSDHSLAQHAYRVTRLEILFVQAHVSHLLDPNSTLMQKISDYNASNNTSLALSKSECRELLEKLQVVCKADANLAERFERLIGKLNLPPSDVQANTQAIAASAALIPPPSQPSAVDPDKMQAKTNWDAIVAEYVTVADEAAIGSHFALDVSGTPITDAGLSALRRKYPFLGILELRNCPNITDTGVRRLARLRMLRTVDLRGCPQITAQGLEALALRSQSLNRIIQDDDAEQITLP